MKISAINASRDPIKKDGTSFVSAQIAVNVQTSPTPNSPLRSSGTFACLAQTDAPDLVGFDPLARQVAQDAVLECGAGGAEIDQELGDGVHATPVMRAAARRLLPSTKDATTAVRFSVLSTFAIMTICQSGDV